MYNIQNVYSLCLDGYTGDVYLLVKLLLPTSGKKRVYNLQSKQIVKLLSQVLCWSGRKVASLSPFFLRAGQRSYVELFRGRRESLGTRLGQRQNSELLYMYMF